MKSFLQVLCIGLITSFCNQPFESSDESILTLTSNLESRTGKDEYLNSPYVTAGDRLYMVGHQDGSFPDLGWHVQGEMGGIWDHPIKLMDGFTLGIGVDTNYWCLTEAKKFINYPLANRHDFELENGLKITRTQFVPDGEEGIVIEYTLLNSSQEEQKLKIDFTGMIDLTPVWLSDSLGIEDGNDQIRFEESLWIAKDSLNNWFTVFGTDQEISSTHSPVAPCSYKRKGKGKDATITSTMTLEAGEQGAIKYFIAGSYLSKEKVLSTYKRISEDPAELLRQKTERYEDIQKTVSINIPDAELEDLYTWTKYNTDWLIRDVPELGRGLSAGIPDYPWWFGTDAGYALRGWLATGQHEEVRSTIKLVLRLSEKVNANGRIMHEASTNGIVFNPGNLNTTPYFIYLLWEYYKWTGDKAFLKAMYPKVQQGLEWILEQDRDGNGYPDGAGMMEIHGLHSEMIDVVVYTEVAFGAAGAMALELGDQKNAVIYMEKANELAKKINTDWWVASASSFADFRATKEETLELIDGAIVRADTINKPWAVEELKDIRKKVEKQENDKVQGHVVHHNWVVNTPMEFGIASAEKAEKALETARKYSNRFGMYVTGIDRDENQDGLSKWKSFSYVGAVMTLPTGVQAIAEANYGHMDHALKYLKKLENSFSYALPGSMYEVSPDYGMIVQAWNIYAVAVPIISHFFGVQPMAHEKTVAFQPQMPTGWDNASISNLIVGDNTLSFQKEGHTYTITQTKPDWQAVLILKDKSQTVYVNEELQDIRHSGNLMHIRLTGKRNKVRLEMEN